MASRFTDVVWPVWEVVRKLGVGSFGGVYEIQRTLPDGQVEKSGGRVRYDEAAAPISSTVWICAMFSTRTASAGICISAWSC